MANVNITEATLQKLMADPAAVKQFPFLRITNKVKKGCSACGRKKQAVKIAPNFRAMKQAVAALPVSQKKALKTAVGADGGQVVVHYKKANGQVVKLKF